MKQFIKTSESFDYNNDSFYIKVNNLIGFVKSTIVGSYIKYGKDKVCDLDLYEESNGNIQDYIKKIYNNKKHFYLLDAHFNIPHTKLKIIYDKLGYIDGTLKVHQTESILDDVNNLPESLKNPLLLLINDYKKTKHIDEYIKILLFVKNNIYPKWSFRELLKGKKEYHEQTFNITDNFDYFFIDVIILPENFRASNLITFKNQSKPKLDYAFYELDDTVINDKISYYKMLKKFIYFLKWIYFNNKIQKNDDIIDTHNYIHNLRENIGPDYNKLCLINNQMEINKIKLTKYNNKLKKHKKSIYQKYINKYNKKNNKLSKEYYNGMNIIDNKCKTIYNDLVKKYKNVLELYFQIK